MARQEQASWGHLEKMFSDYIEGRPVTDTADHKQGSGNSHCTAKAAADDNGYRWIRAESAGE